MNNMQIEKLKIANNKGFTLIELLVVIAVLGILAVGLVGAINPVDKLNASSDSKVLNDIGVVARAGENYATSNNGSFTKTAAELGNSGSRDLKTEPVAPSGYTPYVYTALPAACTTAAKDCTSFTYSGQLKSSKYVTPGTTKALYDSLSGKQCSVAPAATVC